MADENGNINCIDCVDCFRCTDCNKCFGCTDCTTCSYCINCTDCTSCRDCIDSYHCYDGFGFINTSHVSTGYDAINCKNIYSSYVYLGGGGNIYNYTFSSDGFINISSLSNSITNYYTITIDNYFREILVEPLVTFSSFVKFIYEFKPNGEMVEDINIDEDGIIQGTYWGQNNKITIGITPQFIDLEAFIDNNEIIWWWDSGDSFDYSVAIEDCDELGNIRCSNCSGLMCYECKYCTGNYCINCEMCNGEYCINCKDIDIDAYSLILVNCEHIRDHAEYADSCTNIRNLGYSIDCKGPKNFELENVISSMYIRSSSLEDVDLGANSTIGSTLYNIVSGGEISMIPQVTHTSFAKIIYTNLDLPDTLELNSSTGEISGVYNGTSSYVGDIEIQMMFMELPNYIFFKQINWKPSYTNRFSIFVNPTTDENNNYLCSNCVNCTYCYKCSDCDSCSYCSNSSSCANCNYLDHCTLCSTCNYLVGCDNCIECGNSIYISNSNNVYDEIGNIYTVNKNYMETDTINIDPAFKYTEGNVLFTDVNPDTLTINERTGNVSGVISQTPSVNLLYNNQEYTYIFDTAVHHLYSINVMNNTMRYI